MDIHLPYDPEFIESFKQSIQTMLAEANRAMENAQYALNTVVKGIKKIPESTKILAENGWYLPLDFHPVIVNRMAEHIKAGNCETTDNEMVEFLDDELSNIQEQIIKRFPQRDKAIIAAIKAHQKGEYYLSIPVFFAQIEGICNELIGIRFFEVRKNQSKTAPWIGNFDCDSILRMVLEPLNITGPMRRSQDIGNPRGINRHDVLHGDCTDYGESKLNSYKVLSLLNYVSDTVYEAKNHLDNQNPNNP